MTIPVITTLPAKTDSDLGRQKTGEPAADLDRDFPAVELEAIKDRVVEHGGIIGTTSTPEAGSILARLDELEASTSITLSVTTPTSVDGGDSGAVGVGTTAARADHNHAVAVAAPVAVGTANDIGTGTALALATHVHKLDAATTSAQGGVELATSAECITGTDATRAVTPAGLKDYVDQVPSNPQGAGHALAAADIGAIVFASGAGAQAFTLPDLSGSLVSGKAMILTIQQEGAATNVTITPGGSSQIDDAGTGVAFVTGAGRKRVSLFSRDGLNWYSGA